MGVYKAATSDEIESAVRALSVGGVYNYQTKAGAVCVMRIVGGWLYRHNAGEDIFVPESSVLFPARAKVPDTVPHIQRNTRLLTKDGRRIGNAIVRGVKYGIYHIMTDYGLPDRLKGHEILDLFYVADLADKTHKYYCEKETYDE